MGWNLKFYYTENRAIKTLGVVLINQGGQV